MFTRRTATVAMSAPDASCARAITACDEYLPVPMISRDANVRPAMTNGESVIQKIPNPKSQLLTTANEVHDFHRIAIVDDYLGKPLALDDGEVVLDGNPPRVDLELVKHGDHREGLLDVERLTVEDNLHLVRPTIGGPTGRGRPAFQLVEADLQVGLSSFSLRLRPEPVKRPRLGRIE